MTHIPASIEVTPKQAIESADLPTLFPAGMRIYVTDIGEDIDTLVAAAARLRQLGYEPVPHIAARRQHSVAALDERLERTREKAGVEDVLVVGGGAERPAGPFRATADLLETGLLSRHGIKRIGIAGHPEGSPDFSPQIAMQLLKDKQAYALENGLDMRIVTQFGFDPQAFIAWAENLSAHGIALPVHLGVAGPAKLTTLIKYAAMCGVGASLAFLKRNALSVTALAGNQSPEKIVAPIEEHWAQTPTSAIAQLHVFPFGGIKAASQWLHERGSLGETKPLSQAAS